MKNLYLDIMELAINVYSDELINEYVESVRQKGVEEHGFPRLTANLGILIANGRKQEYKEIFLEMMTLCCKSLPVNKYVNPHHGNEFSVKEIVLCILEIEKNGTFSQEITQQWRADLATIVPADCYKVVVTRPVKRVGNWAAFGAASEQLRKFAGIGNEQRFIDLQVESQINWFDENGMYREPGDHILYDVVTRLQLTAVMYFGYNGGFAEELDEYLIQGGWTALKYQSINGELPFGGRSNQFIFNETALASTFEYVAQHYSKKGDIKTAGMFKAAAKLAAEKAYAYLKDPDMYHVKNKYHYETKYGCEPYAYFNKYMATAASFMYLGFAYADDSVEPTVCPAQEGGFIFETSEYYHKLFMNNGEYYVEYDCNAGRGYDTNGIGRIQKKGAPSSICLAVPFAKAPHYTLEKENPSWLALGCSACELEKTKYHVVNKNVAEDGSLEVTYNICSYTGEKEEYQETPLFTEKCRVDENGVTITVDCAEGNESAARVIDIPVFDFDGKNKTNIIVEGQKIVVEYDGWKCIYTTNGVLENTGKIYQNRNGCYCLYTSTGDVNELTLNVEIKK